MTTTAVAALIAAWVLFSGMLAWNHLRVRRARRRQGIAEERPAIRDPRSMHGLLLEGLSFAIAFAFVRSPHAAEPWQQIASIVFSILSIIVLAGALRHLDMEWRIKAVVTEDHRLVTTGPYAIIRHPIFASLFALLLASVLLVTRPWAAIAAVAVCLWGTEIRIRTEDGLLRRRFGPRYEQYQRATKAIIPFLR